jgi:hypothetical protein
MPEKKINPSIPDFFSSLSPTLPFFTVQRLLQTIENRTCRYKYYHTPNVMGAYAQIFAINKSISSDI